MTLPRSVADVLSDHVLFEIEAIDRLYLNLYQPRLQHGGGIASFFVGHRGHRFASSALLAPLTAAFVADIHHYIDAHGLDLVHFRKGQRKDDVTQRYLAQAAGPDGQVPEGILHVGRAQEKNTVFRTVRRTNPVTGASYPWLVRDTALVFGQVHLLLTRRRCQPSRVPGVTIRCSRRRLGSSRASAAITARSAQTSFGRAT